MKLPKTFTAIVNPKPKAIFIACGDPRFQKATLELRDFLELPDGDYVPIGNGGGPVPLAHPLTMPDRCRGMIRQTLFYLRKFPSIERAFLLTHGDCGYYITAPCQCHGQDKESRDVSLAAALVRLAAPKLYIEPYYAELVNGGLDGIDIYRKKIAEEEISLPPDWEDWIREYKPTQI